MDAVNSALECVHLSAGYRRTPVIKDIDLRIREGEMVGILGPNGAGKTTFLRAITGLCAPMAGSIRLFGSDIATLSAAERAQRVSVVPQELETSVAFTVQEIVMIGRTAALSRWRRPASHDWKAVERAMVYTDVVDMRHRPFTQLSGGEKQRTVVAMALAQDPRMIMMDEATSHLDMNHRIEIMQIVERLNAEHGVTILMISHDLNLAAEFCGRLLLLEQGRIVSDGAPSDVLTEENLRRVYHCDVRVQQNPVNGSLTVLPAPRLARGRSGHGIRIHVIAGGGCGEEVFRLLALCDYTVSCGVLNREDSDTDVASALGIETALEKPFSPIGAAALTTATDMVRKADATIVCGVPFGSGNVVNLDLAELALGEGKRVLLMDGIAARDYTASREATARAERLVSNGAIVWQGVADLLKLLPVKPDEEELKGASKGASA